MKMRSYPSRDALFAAVADQLAADLRSALARQDQVTFAVAGGTTPGPVFDLLAQMSDLDWARVKVMLTDERWVPADHDRSNAGLVRARLLVGAAAGAAFLPFYGAGEIGAHVAELGQALQQDLPISVMMLGMGGDMHTASLFPGAPGLAAALSPDAPPLCVLRPEDQPDTRVSLSGPVLAGAEHVHLVITGSEKRAALQRAADLPVTDAPIGVVLPKAVVHWAE